MQTTEDIKVTDKIYIYTFIYIKYTKTCIYSLFNLKGKRCGGRIKEFMGVGIVMRSEHSPVVYDIGGAIWAPADL